MPYVTLKNGNRIEARDEFTGESKGLEFDVANKQLFADYGDGSGPTPVGGLSPEQQSELADLRNDVDEVSTLAASKLDNAVGSHTEGMVPVANENGQLVDNYITNANIASSAAIESSKLAFTSAQSSALASGIDATKVAQIQQNSDDIDLVEAKATHADAEAERIGKLIPSAATLANQLADKAFVNSSIATSTATFRGTFNSLAALEAYSGEKDENDYAFVAETTGSATVYKRYKFDGSAWVFEYELNNSSFTSAQWAAINSGATSGTVAQVETNRTAIISLQNDVAGKASSSDVTAAAATALANTNAVINAVNARQEVFVNELTFSTGSWNSPGVYTDYPHNATAYFDTDVLPLANANSYSGMISFGRNDAVGGNFASYCEVTKTDVTVDDVAKNRWTFRIWAKAIPSGSVATTATLFVSTSAISPISVA